MILKTLDFMTTITKMIKPCRAFATSNVIEAIQTVSLSPIPQVKAQLAISAIHVRPMTKKSSMTTRK